MAMGLRKDRQGDLMVGWAEMPRSPGHVFYDRLQSVLIEGGFDDFVEATCRCYYAARTGAPSVPPGRYFRMHLVGYFEGIDSGRGLEWRGSDSLSLREHLAQESGIETPTAEDLARLDRKRKGKNLSNQDRVSRSDPEARVARMKDAATHLADKPGE